MWDQGFLLSTSADSRLNLWKLDKAGAGGDAYVTFADGVVLDVYDVQDIATFQRCVLSCTAVASHYRGQGGAMPCSVVFCRRSALSRACNLCVGLEPEPASIESTPLRVARHHRMR